MRKTFKPADVFVRDSCMNLPGKDIVTVKFEIPCTADKWVLKPGGDWMVQGTLNLSDIISTNTYEIKEGYRNWEFNDRIANQMSMNIVLACVSLVLPGLSTPLIKKYITLGNMDQFEFKQISPHHIVYGIYCEFADESGLFGVGNSITLTKPNRTEKNKTTIETDKTEMHYLDECVLVVSIDFNIDGFRETINEATVHNNQYAIFGVTTDTNTGKPRITAYGAGKYMEKKSSIESTDELNKYQLYSVDYTGDKCNDE